LRPDKVLRLYKELEVASLAELEAAAKDDRIKKTKARSGAADQGPGALVAAAQQVIAAGEKTIEAEPSRSDAVWYKGTHGGPARQ